jgi:serine phosphatase RsbU (regulator of sigma subunit)
VVNGESLLLMIADVMGKGVPAALFATTMRGLLRGLAERSSDPSQLLSGLNRLLYKELSSVAMFITAQIVLVDLRTRKLTAASAGHCPPLFFGPKRDSVSTMKIRGLPLGVMPDTVYPHQTARMGSPAALLLYTDGLTDTRNKAGVTYGEQRLKAWMQEFAVPGRSAMELRRQLTSELSQFRGDAEMDDDQAFLLLTEDLEISSRFPFANGHRARHRRSSVLSPARS